MNLGQQQKGSLPLVLLIIVLALTVLGAGGYYVYSRNNSEADSSSEVAPLTSAEQTVESEELITTTVTTLLDGGGSLKVTHPKSWIVSQESKDYLDGLKLRESYIKSELGNYLHIYEIDGIGGDCTPNEAKFTLQKRISTSIPNVVFSQYEKSDQPTANGLYLEDHNSPYIDETVKTMEEGDTLTDSCKLFIYPAVRFGTDSLFVSLGSNERGNLSSTLTYDELKADPELLSAVQSLSK
jgi:flagellar basal body-associated protein FliL